jgi:two-component system, OmpR family, response regulator
VNQPITPAHPRSPRVRRLVPSSVAADVTVAEPRLLRCGDLVLDESRWTVHRAGTPVELSPTEFRLLAFLMRNHGTAISRKQLLRQVWGWEQAGHSQVVETYVSYLRRKLDRLGPPLIQTRRGVGYLLRCSDAPPPGFQ